MAMESVVAYYRFVQISAPVTSGYQRKDEQRTGGHA